MAAISQIRHKHSQGRAYYEKKVAEGKTHKEALRALKRRISDAIYTALAAGARRAVGACPQSPGGQPGNHAASRAADSHPQRRHFGQSHSRACHYHTARHHGRSRPGSAEPSPPPPGWALSGQLEETPRQPLDTQSKEDLICTATDRSMWIRSGTQNGAF
jgi:hypothetical protein